MDENGQLTNGELTRTLVRIETKLDAITGDHERRLRRVEMWMYAAAGLGGAGAITSVTSLLGGGP